MGIYVLISRILFSEQFPMNDITLSQLIVYPIKSCRGIEMHEAQVVETGFEFDRRWMLVSKHGKFLSQRQLPKMSLIHIELTSDHLLVTAPAMDPLQIPFASDALNNIPVSIWDDSVRGATYTPDIDKWFSTFLHVETRLVHMPDSSRRPVNQTYGGTSDIVSFADAFPFLLLSEASLNDLNRRMTSPVPMNRFRPNLVVRGCKAFAEDSWKHIQIGSVEFHVVKPCVRCTIPSVDQTTGIQGKEPLTTLAHYRTQNGKVIFGQNCIQRTRGTLHAGDPVLILNER
jgi:uncharacterized protein YcbX